MYKVESVPASDFEFEWDGTVYKIASAKALPIVEVMALADASAAGDLEQTRWLVAFFSSQTDGATDSMPLEEFKGLARKWYYEGNLGKSQASSD